MCHVKIWEKLRSRPQPTLESCREHLSSPLSRFLRRAESLCTDPKVKPHEYGMSLIEASLFRAIRNTIELKCERQMGVFMSKLLLTVVISFDLAGFLEA